MEFTFYKYQEENFLEKVKKLQKKVKIEIRDKKEFVEKELKPSNLAPMLEDFDEWVEVKKVTYDLDFVKDYKIEGFEFLGGLLIRDGAVRIFSEDEDLINKINDDFEFKCFHCNKTIFGRRKKFFFKKLDTGETVSIGSKCAKDYFGFDVAGDIEKSIRIFSNLQEMVDEEFNCGGAYYYSCHDIYMDVAITYFEMGKPFVSARKQEERNNEVIATSNEIKHFVHDPVKTEYERMEREKFLKGSKLSGEQIFEIKQRIYKFYEEMESSDNFGYNLKNLFANKSDSLGFLTYGVYHYFNTLKKEKEEAERKKNMFHPEWYENDELKDVKVKCMQVRGFQSKFGPGTILKFENDKYQFVLFTSSDDTQRIEIGKEYIIKKAKVKDRSEYQDQKQTIIKTRMPNIQKI